MTTQRRLERLAKLNLAQMRTMRVNTVTAKGRSWELAEAAARTKLPYAYPGDGRELQRMYNEALERAR
jgi:hypothetical protein